MSNIKMLKELHGMKIGHVVKVDSHTAKIMVSRGNAEHTDDPCTDCDCEDCGGEAKKAPAKVKAPAKAKDENLEKED